MTVRARIAPMSGMVRQAAFARLAVEPLPVRDRNGDGLICHAFSALFPAFRHAPFQNND
jgi:hypothetical protein